jgi:Uri superfamily endonuclease
MPDIHNLPALPGVYALQLFIARSQKLTIGRLGKQRCPAGHYFYVGSAHGAGGLRARVGRHLRGDGTLHWHIDYLRAVAEVRGALYTVTDDPLECPWSQALADLPGAFIPVPHFGASDCRSGCEAHLIGFPPQTDFSGLPQMLARFSPTPIASLLLR